MAALCADVGAPAGPEQASPLHVAARSDWPGAVRMLLELGADVAAADAKGRTPLHYAAEGACEGAKALRALASAGADVGCADADGNSPLAAAGAAGNRPAVEALLELGADKAARNAGGQTPLDLAELRFRRSHDGASYAVFEMLGGSLAAQ